MKLVEGNGSRRTFVCPFHGWCWGLDGRTPTWRAPRCSPNTTCAPRIFGSSRSGVSCGAGARGSTSTTAPRRCANPRAVRLDLRRLEGRIAAHRVVAVVPAPVNWKLATAAFMEGYHVPQTHPQLLPSAHSPGRPVHPVIQSSLYFMRTLGDGMGGMTHENDIRIAEGLQNMELPPDPAEAMAAWRSTLNDAVAVAPGPG